MEEINIINELSKETNDALFNALVQVVTELEEKYSWEQLVCHSKNKMFEHLWVLQSASSVRKFKELKEETIQNNNI